MLGFRFFKKVLRSSESKGKKFLGLIIVRSRLNLVSIRPLSYILLDTIIQRVLNDL
jgi:hypothetical protein